MGKFFANQKLDEAGVVGVTLQKLLIFFMIVDAVWLFCGGSFFGAFMGILFHFFVFMGVYRRRTAVLLFYVIFHVVSFILVGVAIIFVVSALMYMPPYNPEDNGSGMPTPYNYTGNGTENLLYAQAYNEDNGGFMSFVSRFVNNGNHTRPNNKTRPFPPHKPNPPHGGPNPPPHPHGDSNFDSSYDNEDQNVFLISVAALLVSVIFLYCKILSVVLAHRMRKMLLAANNKSTDTEAQKQQPESVEPVYVPAADFENAHPLFSQPNFMPYQPMVQAPQNLYPGQASAMMPPPFMYGQPVFYTFAPMPENEDNSNNNNQKL